MTDFNLTLVGPRGDSSADLARRLGLVASTASDTEALMAILNRTVSAAAASTGNVSLSSAPATLDGVTLANGDRVLLHAQTAPAENGIYVFTSAGAALTRWAGADAWHELPGLTAGVAGGAAHANTSWTCFSPQGGTLGATPVTFLKLAGPLSELLDRANTWSKFNFFSEGIGCIPFLSVLGGANVTTVASGYTNALTIEQSGTGAGYVASLAIKAGGNTLLVQQAGSGDGDQAIIGTTSAAPLTFRTNNAERWRIGMTFGHLTPGGDNTKNIGSASLRAAVVYAGTGTINTSDATEKTEFAPIPPGVAAAARALMGRIGVYQWLASVAEKGADKARLHLGLKAQDVRDAFKAEGVDPGRWALFCEDPILAPVEKTRSVERQVTREVLRPRETVTVEGGQAVLRVVEETVEEPVFEAVPLVAADGTPIMREVKTVGPDGEPVVVMGPASHMAPVMETVEETYEVMEPTGETRLGLRHEQLLMLFLAVLAERG